MPNSRRVIQWVKSVQRFPVQTALDAQPDVEIYPYYKAPSGLPVKT